MNRHCAADKVAVTEPSKLAREFLVPSSPATAEVVRIITGDERAQYIDTVGSGIHAVQLLDEFGEPTATVLSLPRRADIGTITFCPRSCYGNGLMIRRADCDRGISQADRRTIATFCESLQVRKGGVR